MKLKYHGITHGRYYLAGEELPPDAPESFAKYAVNEDGDAADLDPVKQKPPPPRRYKARKRSKKGPQ